MRHAATILGAVLLLSGASGAQERGGPSGQPPQDGRGPGSGPPPIERALERLGLSEKQKAELKAIEEKDRETMRPLMDAARQAHEEFQRALDSDVRDPATLGQLAITMNAARKKVENTRKASLPKILAVLTPEQRDALAAQALEGGGPGPGRPGGAPGGPGGHGGAGGPPPGGGPRNPQ
jgi:Spy/CpxP family protein refolding chaperone